MFNNITNNNNNTMNQSKCSSVDVSCSISSDEIDRIISNINHINEAARTARITPITAFDLNDIVIPTIIDTTLSIQPIDSKPLILSCTPLPMPVLIKPVSLISHHNTNNNHNANKQAAQSARKFVPSTNITPSSRPLTSVSTPVQPLSSTATYSMDTSTLTTDQLHGNTVSQISSTIPYTANTIIKHSTNATPSSLPHISSLNLSGIINNEFLPSQHQPLFDSTQSNANINDPILLHSASYLTHDNNHRINNMHDEDCDTLPGSVAMLTMRDNTNELSNNIDTHCINSSRMIPIDNHYNNVYQPINVDTTSRPVSDISVDTTRVVSGVISDQLRALHQHRTGISRSMEQQKRWIQQKMTAAPTNNNSTLVSPRVNAFDDIVNKNQQSIIMQQSNNITPNPSMSLNQNQYSRIVSPTASSVDTHTQALIMAQQMMLQQQATSQAHNQQVLNTLLAMLHDKQNNNNNTSVPHPFDTNPYALLSPQSGILSPPFSPVGLVNPTSTQSLQSHTFSPATPFNSSTLSLNALPPTTVPQQPYITDQQRIDLFSKCRTNRHTLVEELFSSGIPVDSSDAYGNQCIHIAAQQNSKRMIKACLRWGADINALNIQGNTPLHYCMAYHYDVLSNYLLSKGASDLIVNFFGYTPSQCVLIPNSRDEAIQKLTENMPTMQFTAEQLEMILGNVDQSKS